MRFPHFLFRSDSTTSLLIVLLVGLFVLAFNAYRLGKISRPVMLLCSAAFVLGVAALCVFGPR